jgi:hypothetical protein
MWRLFILIALVLIGIYYMVFRPGRILGMVTRILYSPISPLSHRPIPPWASYYLGLGDFEGPPPSVREMEDNVKTLGYVLVAVPVALVVTVILVGG